MKKITELASRINEDNQIVRAIINYLLETHSGIDQSVEHDEIEIGLTQEQFLDMVIDVAYHLKTIEQENE